MLFLTTHPDVQDQKKRRWNGQKALPQVRWGLTKGGG